MPESTFSSIGYEFGNTFGREMPQFHLLHTYILTYKAVQMHFPNFYQHGGLKKKKSNINHASFHFLKIAILNTQF